MEAMENYSRFRAGVNPPSRFQLADPTKEESFSGPEKLPRSKQPISGLLFSVKHDTEITMNDPLNNQEEIKISFPLWIGGEIDKHTIKKLIYPQDVIRVCCDRAVSRLVATQQYKIWDMLSGGLQNHEWPQNSDDFTEFTKLRKEFPVSIPSPTNGGNGERRSFRFPRKLFDLMGAVAISLGIKLPILFILLTMDGLRSQKEAVHKDKMDDTIAEFYYWIARRIRSAYAGVKYVWEIEPSEELKAIIEEIESEGVL